MIIEETAYDENTLRKVYDAIAEVDLQVPASKDQEIVQAILNAGILFRERIPDELKDEFIHENPTLYDLTEDYIYRKVRNRTSSSVSQDVSRLLTRDPNLKIELSDMGAKNHSTIIEKLQEARNLRDKAAEIYEKSSYYFKINDLSAVDD